MINKYTRKANERIWLTDGASMVYSGWSLTVYWLINLLLYALLNMFILRIQTGVWLQLEGPYQSGALIPTLKAPLNIFQFPSYILITALLTAMVCTVPILISQLYNFLYAIPFFFVVFFLGHNPVLSLTLLIASLAAGFEPLRFKSKFVAALMCMLPVLLYWWLFSGQNNEQDIRRWAVLYAPWVLAAMFSIAIFGIVLSIGHFLRYRPGLLMPLFGLLLAGTVLLFDQKIGLEERDFQAQVFSHSPAKVPEFQSRSITALLEKELAQRRKQYPALSAELIAAQLKTEWRWTFNSNITSSTNILMSEEFNPQSLAKQEALKFETAWIKALAEIQKFIDKHPNHKRVKDALYYQALLLDMKVDARMLRDKDVLQFYYDRPGLHSEAVWREILQRFPDSQVALEARWHLALLKLARKPQNPTDSYPFDEVLQLLHQTFTGCEAAIRQKKQQGKTASFWQSHLGTIFSPPPPTITLDELITLKKNTDHLVMLLGPENRQGNLLSEERLAQFVSLDPRQLNYEPRLNALLKNAPQPDPLQDNIELALVMLEQNPDTKIARLNELIRQFTDRDGGIEAMLELARILLQQSRKSQHQGDRQHLNEQAQQLLQKIISTGRNDYLFREAKQMIQENRLN